VEADDGIGQGVSEDGGRQVSGKADKQAGKNEHHECWLKAGLRLGRQGKEAETLEMLARIRTSNPWAGGQAGGQVGR
jgi:hypothetical protein